MKRASLLLPLLAVLVLSGYVWPPAPEVPKIKFLQNLNQPADVGIAQPTANRWLSFIFGDDKKQPRSLKRPQGIAGLGDKICVTDTSQGAVHVFDLEQKQYFVIQQAGKEDLISPVGVVIDRLGRIIVSDSSRNKVYVFFSDGRLIKEIGTGQLSRPTGLAMDHQKQLLYVVDTVAGQVKVFDRQGDYLRAFGRPGSEPGAFNHPTYIAVDHKGNVYVVDSLNFRVQIFAPDGKFISQFGQPGNVAGTFSLAKGIALDSEGNIYISDASHDNIQIFNRAGKLLLYFGQHGAKPGEFWQPAGMFIDENDKLYVADSYNQRVGVFQYLK